MSQIFVEAKQRIRAGQNDAANRAALVIVTLPIQNKTLNFVVGDKPEPNIGEYMNVRVTQAFPNSLLGELVS